MEPWWWPMARRNDPRIRSRPIRVWIGLVPLTCVLLLVASCSNDDESQLIAGSPDLSTSDSLPSSGDVLQVPAEYPTIQEAVDDALAGDLVLISPGTYTEEVTVTTDDLVIRGLDRNEVILDGGFELSNGIRVIGANGVAIENMTAMNYRSNGFLWTSVLGYRGSYLTAWRNGEYGIYAFNAVGGLIEHSYAAGSGDAGLYIGQCYPCDAVITDSVAEHNALGYSGTNAGGNLYVVNSVFRYNRMGIVPNSGTYEMCYPQRRTTIMGNRVYSNNQMDTPAYVWALQFMGTGIFSAGGIANTVAKNRVWDHDRVGIGLVPYVEVDPSDSIPDRRYWDDSCATTRNMRPNQTDRVLLWEPFESQVVDNVVEDSRWVDLLVASAKADVSTLGNCFAGNDFAQSSPSDIETLAPCDGGSGSGDWSDTSVDMQAWLARGEWPDPNLTYDLAPLPDRPVLANMPNAATAPAVPASAVPPVVDESAIVVPERLD